MFAFIQCHKQILQILSIIQEKTIISFYLFKYENTQTAILSERYQRSLMSLF